MQGLVQDVPRIRIDQNNQTESTLHSTMKVLSFHLIYHRIDQGLET